MNKKAILLLNVLALGLLFNVSTDAKIGYVYSSYEYQLEAELDLGVIGRKLSFVFEFFDQSNNVIKDFLSYQESMHNMIILPMYDRCNGNYKGMIQLIRSSHRSISRILKSAKRAGAQSAAITQKLKKRKAELSALLSFMRKNRLLMSMLWSSARADARYGNLIHSYKSLAKKTDHAIVQGEEFEKELLYTACNRISRKHRVYPTVYFMRRFLLKDLKRYKRQYERSVKRLKRGFAVTLSERKYHDLSLLKASIESMDLYNQEKKLLAKKRVLMPIFLVGGFLLFGGLLQACIQSASFRIS